jgi:hypothetical protein
MDKLRSADMDAWAMLHACASRAAAKGLPNHHVAPMRANSDRMGELKATGADMYRLYYGEPNQQDDLVVGL